MWTIYKKKVRIQKFKETGDSTYIYKNDLDKACFQHNMAYGDFKNLAKTAASDKVLRDKAFSIAKNPKYVGYQGGLPSAVYKCFDTKSSSLADKSTAGGTIKNEIKQNEQLAKELHKPIIKKCKTRKYIHHLKKIFGCWSYRYAINH